MDLSTALARLREFSTWENNWDGENTLTPRQANLDSAHFLLELLYPQIGGLRVALNGDGDPMIMVFDGDFEMSITVVSENELSYMIVRLDDERSGLVEFDHRTLPAEISSAIAELR